MTMIGLGSIVNAAAIVAGGCVGLVAGKAISERAFTLVLNAPPPVPLPILARTPSVNSIVESVSPNVMAVLPEKST